MAKIFISGVAGFLGSHLADRFIEKGHEVIGCDSLIGGYQDNINPKVTFSNKFKVESTEMKKVQDRAHRYCFIANSLSNEVKVLIN